MSSLTEINSSGSTAPSAPGGTNTPALIQPADWPRRLEMFYARWRTILWLGLIATYLGGFSTLWSPEPDSALYLSTARNLARGQGYTYQGEPNTLAWPGYPHLLAGLFKATYVDNIPGAHVLSLGMTLAFLALVYRLFLRHAGSGVAMIVTGMTGMSQLVFGQAFQLRNDMPFALGAIAFLAGYERLMQRADAPHLSLADLSALGRSTAARITRARSKYQSLLDWSLIIAGLIWAMAMRPNGWVLLSVIALAGLVHPSTRRQMSALLAVGIVAAVAFLYFDPRNGGVSALGSYEAHLRAILAHPLNFLRGPFLANLRAALQPTLVESTLGMEFPLAPINAALGLVAVAWSFSFIRARPLWTLWVLATVACLLIEPTGRYLLAVVPLFAFGWWRAAQWWMRRRRLGLRWRNILFAVVLALWVLPNAWQVAYTMGKQRRIGWVQRLGRTDPVPYEQIGRQLRLRRALPPGAFVLAPRDRSRPFSYLLDRVTLEPADLATRRIPPDAPLIAVIPDGEEGEELRVAILFKHGWQIRELLAHASARGRADWRAFRIVRPAIMYARSAADPAGGASP